MKVGYGYNRLESALTDLGAERIYIDTPKTGRQERAEMMQQGLREGNTLVMLASGDLAMGGEKDGIWARIKAMGVTIEIPDSPKKYSKPGCPAKFDPDADQDAKIKTLYHDYFAMWHVLKRATEIMGHKVERHQLIHRYGKRWTK